MSGRTETAAGECDSGPATDGSRGSVADLVAALDAWLPGREGARTVAAGAAAAVVVVRLVVTLLHNAPFDPLSVPPTVLAALAVATPAVLATGLIVVALTAERPSVRVGTLFAAAFGPLAAIDASATLPAVLGVGFGGALALAGTVGRPRSYVEGRTALVAAGFALAVVVSLGSSTGLLGGGRQVVGSAFALGSLAVVGLLGSGQRSGPAGHLPAIAGLGAFAAVLAAGVTSPYLMGSVLLVGFAVVGVPHLLFALAAAGGVAAFAGAIQRRALAPAFGTVLLLAAGVPVTLPRAMAVLLGAALFLSDPTLPGTDTGRGDRREVDA